MNQILQIMNVLCTFVLFFIILFLRLSILLTDTFSIAIFFFFFFVTQVQDIDKEWCFEYDWNVHKLRTEC